MTEREHLFLFCLCVCVRAFTLGQAMRLLGFHDRSNFCKFVRALIQRDLVRPCRVFAKPVPEMREPLYACEAPGAFAGAEMRGGNVEPLRPEVIRQVLRVARLRWAGLPASSVTVYVATKRAGNLFGVRRKSQIAQPLQASHDLAVSAVYVATRVERGEGEHWYGEDFAGGCGLEELVPDAVILDAQRQLQKVIEIVGEDYDELKLRRVHEQCNARALSYELW